MNAPIPQWLFVQMLDTRTRTHNPDPGELHSEAAALISAIDKALGSSRPAGSRCGYCSGPITTTTTCPHCHVNYCAPGEYRSDQHNARRCPSCGARHSTQPPCCTWAALPVEYRVSQPTGTVKYFGGEWLPVEHRASSILSIR